MGDLAFECLNTRELLFLWQVLGKTKPRNTWKKSQTPSLDRSVSYPLCDSHCPCLLQLQYSQPGLMGLAYNPYNVQGQRHGNSKTQSHSGLQSKFRANLSNLERCCLTNIKGKKAKVRAGDHPMVESLPDKKEVPGSSPTTKKRKISSNLWNPSSAWSCLRLKLISSWLIYFHIQQLHIFLLNTFLIT